MTLNLRNLTDKSNCGQNGRDQTSFTCHGHSFKSLVYALYQEGFQHGQSLVNPVSDNVNYRQGYLDSLVLVSKAS